MYECTQAERSICKRGVGRGGRERERERERASERESALD